MKTIDDIFRRIEEFRDEMIDLQIQLCGLPAISPVSGGEGEAQKAEFLLQYLQDKGYDSLKVLKAPDLDAPAGYRPNIIALYKGQNSSKTIWIMTHLDVVPPGELSLWKGNPFKAWVEEGKIYGRGVEDNQQDMVAAIFSLEAFREEGLLPHYDVGLLMVADEETGSEKGIKYVLQNNSFFKKNDLIIVPDAGNPEGTMIEVAEKSILWLKFTVVGQQAHASTPEKGINAFRAGSALVIKLNSLYDKFALKNSLFDPPISTFEPTKKESNVPNINTIPGEDVFYLDCRLLPEYSIDEVEEEIKNIAREIEAEYQVKITFQEEQRTPAAPPTSPQASVVQALQKAIKAVYHVEGQPVGIGGGTVASFFRDKNFEAACWSKVDETAHQPNEYCIIDNMIGDAKVFAHIFLQD
ncbi:MAG TPA: M20 family metallo-hydrolase [Candidatus Aminicenantes bacterium]|nr:M20 family metallo-hydrolase [Candidatus Aminicenantes bacterium]